MRHWMVVLALSLAANLGAAGTQEPAPVPEKTIEFQTEDGVTLHGTLTGTGRDILILSNQHHATEFLWGDFVGDLVRAGWTVLTYEYRGIGKSGGSEAVPEVDRDLRAAYRVAVGQRARKIALVGASLGSIVSLKMTPVLKPDAVVLLSVSPGLLGMNLADDPAAGAGAPLLFITSEYDFASKDTQDLAAQFAGSELLVVPASDHGVALVDGPYGDDVRQRVLSFLKSRLK